MKIKKARDLKPGDQLPFEDKNRTIKSVDVTELFCGIKFEGESDVSICHESDLFRVLTPAASNGC